MLVDVFLCANSYKIWVAWSVSSSEGNVALVSVFYKDVAYFFQNGDDLARQKMKASTERRHKKGPTALDKTKAEIKLLAQQKKEERLQEHLQAKQMRLAKKKKRMEATVEAWATAQNKTAPAQQAALRQPAP